MKVKRNTTTSAFRVGIGYDIHRLDENRKLILGGIHIPAQKGLLGHSDADVLIHAICDALLGSVSLGDIGKHFPNTDKKYKDVSSLLLLKKTAELLQQQGYIIGNIDATVILESPKIGKFIDKMRAKICRTLKITAGQISIKATTNEELGALGRKEGCAAMAIALLIANHKV